MSGEPAIHPAAQIFPAAHVAELKSLAEDIKTHSLIEPIRLHQGMIIDGRNRLSACRIAGIDPRYETADLGNLFPVMFVIQQNLERRKLSKSQLAAVAAISAELLRMEIQNLKRLGKPCSMQLGDVLRDTLAKALGISSKAVQDAVNVKKENPELFQRLWSGEISLLVALSKLDSTPPQRRAERLGNYQKRKMIEILSHIRGLCRGLREIDLTLVELNEDDRKAWLGVISQTTLELRQFGQKLKKESHEASHHQIESNQD